MKFQKKILIFDLKKKINENTQIYYKTMYKKIKQNTKKELRIKKLVAAVQSIAADFSCVLSNFTTHSWTITRIIFFLVNGRIHTPQLQTIIFWHRTEQPLVIITGARRRPIKSRNNSRMTAVDKQQLRRCSRIVHEVAGGSIWLILADFWNVPQLDSSVGTAAS